MCDVTQPPVDPEILQQSRLLIDHEFKFFRAIPALSRIQSQHRPAMLREQR